MIKAKMFLWPLCLLAFSVLSLYLLGVELKPFLIETAALTPFYTTTSFIADMLSVPCGFVGYIASMMQSCFAMPWLGALLLTLLLVALAESMRRVFKVSAAWSGLCLVPSFMLILNYTEVGYMLWLVKTPALAFTIPLGLLISVGLTAIAMVFHKLWIKLVLIVLYATVGYWLFGLFGLLACLFVVLPMIAETIRTRQWKHLSIILGILLLALVLPRVMYGQGLFSMRVQDIYVAGLPDYIWNDAERYLYYPALVAIAFCLLLSTTLFTQKNIVCLIASLIGMIVAAICLFNYTYRDSNFFDTLEQKQALEQGDYERVFDIARTAETPPTRIQVMLTREALWQTGQAGDKMFAYPDGDTPCNSPRQFQYMRLLCGRLFYYLEGKVNYAYRWCMEDMVEYGRRPDYLCYMTKCALVNGEWKLADKYLDALDHTLWYKDFATKYRPYVTDHSLVAKDKEMSAIKPLLRYNDVLDGDGGLIELFVLNSYAYSNGGSREIVERALMNSLIIKNLDNFWYRFMSLLPGWNGHIPVHFQEAALMVAQLQGGVDTSKLPIDNAIRERFAQLVEKSGQNGDNASNAYLLKPEFGDTYWYYYFFVQGLKTN